MEYYGGTSYKEARNSMTRAIVAYVATLLIAAAGCAVFLLATRSLLYASLVTLPAAALSVYIFDMHIKQIGRAHV